MKKIPFLPFSLKKVRKVSKHLLGWGESVSKFFPSLEFDLEQSEFNIEPREWVSVALVGFLFYFLLLFGLMFTITAALHIELMRVFFISFLAGCGIGFGVFFFIIFYPKFFVKKKLKGVEKNLPYVLRHLLVQVRSGVPLYNCFVSIARSNYGILSQSIAKVVNEINTGKSEAEALEMLARSTPSLYFRRVMWQLINALKSGADVGSTLKEIVDNMAVEERVAIKKYGSQLNPLALMYMLFAVIFPTLGITFLLILSSFTGLAMNLEFLLMGILAFLFFFQFMFIGLVKSRRPIGVD